MATSKMRRRPGVQRIATTSSARTAAARKGVTSTVWPTTSRSCSRSAIVPATGTSTKPATSAIFSQASRLAR